MCLISKTNIPKIAEEDIICYKILEYTQLEYTTPFMYLPIRDSIVEAIGDEDIYKKSAWFRPSKYSIGRGFIHAYTTYETAMKIIPEIECQFFTECQLEVFKAVIPKGTKYFVSINGKEICAKKMVLPEFKNIEHVFNN